MGNLREKKNGARGINSDSQKISASPVGIESSNTFMGMRLGSIDPQ